MSLPIIHQSLESVSMNLELGFVGSHIIRYGEVSEGIEVYVKRNNANVLDIPRIINVTVTVRNR